MYDDMVRDALVGSPDRGRRADLVDGQGVERMRLGGSGVGRHSREPDAGVMFLTDTASHQ
jgi:hypothetical protein